MCNPILSSARLTGLRGPRRLPGVMKSLALSLVFTAALALPAVAQDYSAKQSGTSRGQDFIKQAFPEGQPKGSDVSVPLKPFDPVPTGALEGIYRNGLIMISPLAPARYGYGTQYLSKYPADSKYFSLTTGANTDPPYGGIELIGWDF